MKILEDIFGIKFKGFKSRKDLKQNKKLLEDLSLDSKRTIIFDNKPTWPKDNLNIIISKVFIDKDFIQFYSKRLYGSNELHNFLFNFFPFLYYKSERDCNDQMLWKKQKVYNGNLCPFYYFNNNNKDNDCYSGEYLESSKLQFIYMKNIIKIIYYFVFNYDIHVYDILKLIRYNIFYKTYFSLKYYKGTGKDILINIIENCGGKICDENKYNLLNDEKLFFICRKDDYFSIKGNIREELLLFNNSKVVNEKYILDSFFFMTNLEKELNESEYAFDC